MSRKLSMRRTPVHGFTLIELLTVIAIIGILAAILIPVVGRVRDSARNVECMSNIRQWGQAVIFHAMENDGFFAVRDAWTGGGASSWAATGSPYVAFMQLSEEAVDFRRCPSDTRVGPRGISYAMNFPTVNGVRPPRHRIPLSNIPNPSSLLLIVDARGDLDSDPHLESMDHLRQRVRPLSVPPFDRHGGGMNAVFGDGHVRRLHWASRGEGDPDSFEVQWPRWSNIQF